MCFQKNVLVIIPAYCEENSIGGIVRKIDKLGYDVLVINDHSIDNTALVAESNGAVVISLPINLGYAGALQVGYHYSINNGYDCLVQIDGDGQHDPDLIADLIAPINSGECDIVMGSRFLGDNGYNVALVRRLGQLFFASLASLAIKEKISDPTTGYQALSRNVVELLCTQIFPDSYPDADLRILFHRLGFKVKELPVKMYASESNSMHSGIIKPLYYIYNMTLAIIMAPFRNLSMFKRYNQ